jgi:hypothetical protein
MKMIDKQWKESAVSYIYSSDKERKKLKEF